MVDVSPLDHALPPDRVVIDGLVSGDEKVFAAVFDAWSAGMARVARSFVDSSASAEDVVQDTWLAVLAGIGGFEGRSSLKSWVFAILVNVAKTRGVKDSRIVLFDGVLPQEQGPTVERERMRGPGQPYSGHWAAGRAPAVWALPEDRALNRELRGVLAAALEALPARQRLVITLRDVEGLSSAEAAEALGMSAGNFRIVLHRARASVRKTLEEYFTELDTAQEVRR